MLRANSLRDMHTAGDAGIDDAMNKIRMFAVSCGCCPLIYAAVICGVYWGWMNKANDYDDKVQNWQGDISAFDSCGGLYDSIQNAGTINT